MTRPYNTFEVERAKVLKAYRTAIRLKHSLAADAEIAEVLPQIEAKMDEALHLGTPLVLDPATAFGDTL